MSETPTTLTGKGAPIMERILDTIAALQKAKEINDRLQEQFAPGSTQWHMCESIDDQIHEALAHLGE